MVRSSTSSPSKEVERAATEIYQGAAAAFEFISPGEEAGAEEDDDEDEEEEEEDARGMDRKFDKRSRKSYARMAMYNALANLFVALAVAAAYLVFFVLKEFWSPILWAILCSIVLREAKDAIIGFWRPHLERSLLTAASAPAVLVLRVIVDRCAEGKAKVVNVINGALEYFCPSAPRLGPSKSAVMRRRAASMKKPPGSTRLFEWLFVFALLCLGYEVVTLEVLQTSAILGALYVSLWIASSNYVESSPSFVRNGGPHQTGAQPSIIGNDASVGRGSEYGPQAPAGGGGDSDDNLDDGEERKGGVTMLLARLWDATGIVRESARCAYHGLDRWICQMLLSSLHSLVAVCLILGMVVGAIALVVFFSYQMGQEGKAAVISVNQQIRDGAIGNTTAVHQWLAESHVLEYVDLSMEKTSVWAKDQLRETLEKYNLTELVDVFWHEFGGYIVSDHHRVINSSGTGGSISRAKRETPLRLKAETVKQKLVELQMQDAFAEIQDMGALLLHGLHISKDQFMEHARVVGSTAVTALKAVIAQSSSILLGGASAVAVLGKMMLLGAVGAVGVLIQLFLFLMILFYLLSAESDPWANLMNVFPAGSTRDRVSEALGSAVRGVLISSLKLVSFQSLFTWLLYRAAGVGFRYTSTVIAGVTTVLPFVPVWLASIPGFLHLLWERGLLLSLPFLFAHIWVMQCAMEAIYSEIPGSHAYLTGLSIFGGMSVFKSPVQGAIMGPVLVTLAAAVKNLYMEFIVKVEAS